MPHADGEHRNLAYQSLNLLNGSPYLPGIARTIRKHNRFRFQRHHIFVRIVVGNHPNLVTRLTKESQNISLDPIVIYHDNAGPRSARPVVLKKIRRLAAHSTHQFESLHRSHFGEKCFSMRFWFSSGVRSWKDDRSLRALVAKNFGDLARIYIGYTGHLVMFKPNIQ